MLFLRLEYELTIKGDSIILSPPPISHMLQVQHTQMGVERILIANLDIIVLSVQNME